MTEREQSVPERGPHSADEWVPLRQYMELRVQLAESATQAAESRSEIKFAQVAHDAEITRLLNEAKFKEHNTALEQMGKIGNAAAVAQEKQANEFARKSTVEVEMRGLAKQIDELKSSRDVSAGTVKGGEDLRRIGMLVVAAIVAGIGTLVFAAIKLGAT